MTPNFISWRRQQHAAIVTQLKQALPSDNSLLAKAMRYATLGQGKRLRPLLCLATAACCGGSRQAIYPACAVELIHCYSLIHDDLPCMDDDLLRRGKPSCHAKYGEATALLAGDGLQALGFAELGKARMHLAATKLLADACGYKGMVGGQGIDMEGSANTLTALRRMHARKSGSLLAASAQLGGLAANAPSNQLTWLLNFGRELGILFQIADDILDETAHIDQIGKTPGQDRKCGRSTYVTTIGLDKAKRQLHRVRKKIYQILEQWPDNANLLRQLCDWAVPMASE